MPTIRTLLSGGELFGVGARAAGYTHLDGYELDPKIAAVARLNGFDVRQADICDVDYASLPDVDHLHGSPVCTRASSANVGATEADADLAMADAVCRAIAAHKGNSVSIENVWAYRTFESFKKICAALTTAGFVYEFRHINAADYGVPQTRKRLILRAVRGGRVPPLHPTHRKGGDMFSQSWIGWYAAIEDLIPSMPESAFADWQLKMMALSKTHLLVGGQYGQPNTAAVRIAQHIIGSEPAWTITTGAHKDTRAFIVHANDMRTMPIRMMDEPMFTVLAGSNTSHMPDTRPRAWLVPGANDFRMQSQDKPAITITGNASRIRAWLATGRVIKMTIHALGRFQSVPDGYIGLTPQINGNGVPCLLAQRIMESLL